MAAVPFSQNVNKSLRKVPWTLPGLQSHYCLIEVQLVYNVVFFTSAVEQSDCLVPCICVCVCVCVCILFHTLFHHSVSQDIDSSLGSTVGPCFLSTITLYSVIN